MAGLKEYDCAQVGHHERIAGVIEEYKKSEVTSPHLSSPGVSNNCESLFAI
jgi:hypothetical protein